MTRTDKEISPVSPPDAPDLIGNYTVRTLPFFRRIFIDSLNVMAASPNMLALVEFDIAGSRSAVREARRHGAEVSFQAFFLKSVAEAVSEWPELNAIPTKKKLYVFEDIDINMPLELDIDGVQFPKQIVIRRANTKSVTDIYREIEAARQKFLDEQVTGEEDRWALRLMRLLTLFPAFVRRSIIRRISSNPLAVKKNYGTLHYTTVAGFAAASGFVIPCLVNGNALDVTCGSIERKAVVRGHNVESRETMSVTLMFNHGVIDGAPAARFSRRLKQLVESGEVLGDLRSGGAIAERALP